MNKIRRSLRFLRTATLWDVDSEIPERTEDHYDTNTIYKPDRNKVQKIWEGQPKPGEEPQEEIVKDLDLTEKEPGVESDKFELGNGLSVTILEKSEQDNVGKEEK